ncbi:fluoride efflux transporter FluC [Microlunatus parietis]|uniref:Fluoride-specific ion channel FluC n=1 Tax=Microlunatus parietis TaxID=682979 RepID=A0A7Y9I290_9ACTN|nr:CrcB family protein [Microlunatus parietis]NYE68787.1 CrcB protein [Microlunatus parietis]
MPEFDHEQAAEPVDPDLAPAHPPAVSVALVALGGTLGTAARALIAEAVPQSAGIPLGILAINLGGAYLLGLLLAVLHRLGPDVGRRRAVRLLCGTGVLGGFTTYSALATDSGLLLLSGDLLPALGYALVTVLAGALCSWAGLATGSLVRVPAADPGEPR